MLGYALSIHWSKWITLKTIVDVDDKDFQVDVVLLRVKSLAGLLLKPSFNSNGLLNINKSPSVTKRRVATNYKDGI